MATSISRTWGAETGSFYPVTVSGYQTTRPTLNVTHDILGGGSATSMRGGGLRTGSLAFLFTDETAAFDALSEISKFGLFSLADDDRPSIAMNFVVTGDVSLDLDDASRDAWVLTVTYREVTL